MADLADGDNTPSKTPAGRTAHLKPPWQPGQSGNPNGRPKGARSKLSEKFFEALLDDFERRGETVIGRVGDDKPSDYVKVIASLIARDIENEGDAAILMAMFGNGRINRRLNDDAD